MANPFDAFDTASNSPPGGNPFDEFDATAPSRQTFPPRFAQRDLTDVVAARRRPAVQHHSRQTPQPGLGERLKFNIADAMANTLRGAAAMVPVAPPDAGAFAPGFQTSPELAGSPIENIAQSPLGEAVRSGQAAEHLQVRAAQQEAVKRFQQRQQFPLPRPSGPLQWGTAVAGQLAGSATSPEAAVPVSRGATLLKTFIRGAAATGILGFATDPVIQDAQIKAGVRDKFDPVQPFLSGAGGAFLGGTLNVAPEIAGQIARAVGRQLGKAYSAVSNSDVFNAFRNWLRSPETMPAELRAEPELQQAPAVAPNAAPAPTVAPKNPFDSFDQPAPAAPVPPRPAPAGAEMAVTPRGTSVPVAYEVVPLAGLIASHQSDLTPNPAFPRGLQPRERTRAASQAQIAEIAGSLNPALLGRSPSVSEGAPIIGPDNVVESGNARILALGRAYAQNPQRAGAYRSFLKAQGFDIGGIENPVLIRRRLGDMTPAERQAFTVEANERTTLAPSAVEQAGSDAKGITGDLMGLYRGGDLNAGVNSGFVRSFIDKIVSPAERGEVFDPQGGLSQAGLRRIENALFVHAYGDRYILGHLREAHDTNIKGIGTAMVDVAPLWSKLRSEAAAGRIRKDMDITPALVEAARLVSTARTKGVSVGDLVRQGDVFAGQINPTTRGVLGLMFSDPAYSKPVSRDKLAGSLRYYADQASKATTAPTLDLGAKPAEPADILALAKDRGTAELFERKAGGNVFDQFDSQLPNVANAGNYAAAPGVNYVGSVVGTFNPAVATTPAPIRRETILRDLMTALDASLYEGRIKSPKTLGFFRKPIEEVRIKHAGDIETTAHEIAHLLDFRFPEIKAQWLRPTKANAAIRAELSGVSYDKKKLYEGFAEFVRLWMTQPNQAAAKAPNFLNWWEGFVQRSEYGPALLKAREGMLSWFNQAAVDRARSKIGATQEINGGNVSVWDKWRQSITDDLHGIAVMERDMTGKLSPLGAYETARLTRAKSSIVEGALTIGAPVALPDGSHKFVGKGLVEIMDPVADRLDDALMYFVGKSANELKQQGREHLFSGAEISGMLALRSPEFEKALAEYQVWNNAILDFAEAKGIVNPMHRAAFKRAQYMPFHRVGQPGGVQGPVQGDFRGIKALTGGSENLRPILGNMIGNARMLIDAALTNEARLKVVALAKQEGGGKFLAQIPRDEKWVRIPPAEIERAVMEAFGVKSKHQLTPEIVQVIDALTNNMQEFARFLLKGQTPTGRNVMAVMEGGRANYYEVADPLLLRAVTALQRPTAHWLVRTLNWPRRIGQASVTLSLDFMAANIVRDTLSGFVMSKHGFRPMIDSAIGLKSRLLSDPNYKDFVANGGGFSSHLLDERAMRTHLERFYGRKGIDYRTVLDAPQKLLFALERIADAFEMSTRLGEYRRAIQKGEHPRHAAYSAREVSTDFAMRGDSALMGAFFDSVIFLKAGVVSMDRAYRGFVEDSNRASIIGKTAVIAGISALLYAVNRGNPLYDKLEDWDRDSSWHIFIPKPATLQAMHDGTELPGIEDRYFHWRVPRIWEIGAFASIAERQLEGILKGQPIEAQEHMGRVILQLFNLDLVPQAGAPLYELAINKDRFTGRPIETQSMQELEPFARSGPYTSPSLATAAEQLRKLPRWAQVSPAQVEHLLRGYLNTWAGYGLTLSDAAFFDRRPDARLDELPVIRRFFREEPSPSNRYIGEFYDALKATTEARRTMSAMLRQGNREIGEEIAHSPANLQYRQLTHANDRMDAFNAESRALYRLSDLREIRDRFTAWTKSTQNDRLLANAKLTAWDDAGKLKRLMLDDIIRQRNAFAEKVVEQIKQRQQQ